MTNRKLERIVTTAYFEWLISEVPSLLQIITFMAFLALIIKNSFVVGLLIAILIALYITSVRDRKMNLIVQHVNFDHNSVKLSKREIGAIVKVTAFADIVVSGLAGVFMTLLSTQIVKLID